MTKNFYFLLTGYTFSLTADWLYRLAVPMLVYKLTASSFNTALTYALTMTTYLIFSPFGGAIAYSFDKRKILIFGDFFGFIFSIIFAIYISSGVQNFILFYVIIFLIASIPPMYHPTFQSFLPSIVEPKDLVKANSMLSSADNLMTAYGPIFSGILIAAYQIEVIIMLTVIPFFIPFICVLSIKYKSEKQNKNMLAVKKIFQNIADGFIYTTKNKVIFSCSILFFFLNSAINLINCNLSFILQNKFSAQAFDLGVSYSIIHYRCNGNCWFFACTKNN
ncbi:MFS transporter [Fluviispira vulneris]|uniref:MFS transporter n=1 Tax=Fluviispira vulneris TaxID=2763012 RepID=UPI0016482C81|nr:MFS transporter [Fluviispira vulneris]